MASCFQNGEAVNGVGMENIGWFAWNNTNQSIPPLVYRKLNLTVKRDESPTGMCDLATDRVTIPKEGRYSFTSHIQGDGIDGQFTIAHELWKNGAMIAQSTEYNSFTSIRAVNVCLVDWCVAGDYYEVYIYHNSSFNFVLLSATCEQNFFSGAAMYIK